MAAQRTEVLVPTVTLIDNLRALVSKLAPPLATLATAFGLGSTVSLQTGILTNTLYILLDLW